MARKAAFLVVLLVLAVGSPAPGAGPELKIAADCETTGTGSGATVAVPIEFKAGQDDGTGLANAVSSVDFGLEFDSEAFTVTEVRRTPLLDNKLWDEPLWEGVLFPDEPLPKGSISIALFPKFVVPLPTLPDGELVEVVMRVTPGAPLGCASIKFAPGSVVLSQPPLGAAIAAGALTDGGVHLGEDCGDCQDNDGDGAIDLADPDCAPAELTLKKLKLKRGREPKIVIKATLSRAVQSFGQPVQLTVVGLGEAGSSAEVYACTSVAQGLCVPNRKGKKCAFKTKQCEGGVVNLVLRPVKNRKQDMTKVKAVLCGVDISEGTTVVGVSLNVGAQDSFYSLGQCRKKRKGLVCKKGKRTG